MASIAEINVRIGARIQDLQKGLNKAERELRRSARKMSQLGSEMTQMISLPIIGIGAAAIKSAGDMEQLENGLASIMGDAAAAAKELERLKEAAQNPGLGFTQAVKGSVRLQSVGLDAELARKALLNFGNAIALAGGSATDLDGVSLALTQIISKGKISAEEINQLAERVPQVRKAIKEGFGTADSEELQKLGVSAEDFVEKVIYEMGKLPKATGGIKNAITNAGISIQVFLSDLGKDIDKTFDVQGMVKKFGDTLTNLAERFKSLDAGTKKTILQVVAFVAAIGPAIKIIGTLKNVYAGAISVVSSLVGTFKNVSGAVLVAAANFQKLNLVMKASVIGAVVAAAVAAVAIFKSWNSELSEAEKIQQTLTSVNTKAAQSIVEQKMKVEDLAKAVKDETKSEKERLSALNELQRISPKHFGNLDLEKGKYEDLTEAVSDYSDTLMSMANIQAASEMMVDLKKELLDTEKILDKTKPAWDDFEAIQIRMSKFGESRREALAKLWAENAKKYQESLKSRVSALGESIIEEKELLKERGELLNSEFDEEKKIKPLQARLDILKKIKELENEVPPKEAAAATFDFQRVQSLPERESERAAGIARERDMLEQLAAAIMGTESAQKKLQNRQELVNGSIAAFATNVTATTESIAAYNEQTEAMAEAQEAWEARQEKIAEVIERVNKAAEAAGDAMQRYAAEGGKSLKELGKIALKSAADFVRAEMMKAVASFIQKTISISGPLGLLIAGAGAAAVGALFNTAIGSLKVPALAQGALATGPTLAVVGDNAGASSGNPEVIAPLNKLKQMMGDMGGGRMQVEVIGRVSGDQLLLVMDNAARNRMRVAGY